MAPHITRRRFLVNLSHGAAGIVVTAPLLGKFSLGSSVEAKYHTGYAYDARFASYFQNSVEVPQRVTWIHQQLLEKNLITACSPVTPESDPEAYIAKVHSPKHISGIHLIPVNEANGATERIGVIADLAVAHVLGAVRDVCEGTIHNAFCNIRPPGHHQTNLGYTYGYCCFANAVIATRYALDSYPDDIERVLIVDWDYHHGNGTEALIKGNPAIMFYDTCSGSFYSGGDENRHGLMNEASGNEGFLEEWEQELLPLARQFGPDLIIVCCGFDSKRFDIMGGLGLTARGYSLLTKKLMDLAAECGHGRIVSILEGGYMDSGSKPYTFTGLIQCAENHVRTLLTGDVQPETPFFKSIKSDEGKRIAGYEGLLLSNGTLYLKKGSPEVTLVSVTDFRGKTVLRKRLKPGIDSIRLSSRCPQSHLIIELHLVNGRTLRMPWDNF
ncbi:MAG: histone deacetylase [Chitinispirillaceae bacterium]|nr:histone deacetylase [Chitinispirillaceae bacterium]